VLDLRTIVPYDWDAIAAHLTRVNRIVVAHEDPADLRLRCGNRRSRRRRTVRAPRRAGAAGRRARRAWPTVPASKRRSFRKRRTFWRHTRRRRRTNPTCGPEGPHYQPGPALQPRPAPQPRPVPQPRPALHQGREYPHDTGCSTIRACCGVLGLA
jgi:hypothetical protein